MEILSIILNAYLQLTQLLTRFSSRTRICTRLDKATKTKLVWKNKKALKHSWL